MQRRTDCDASFFWLHVGCHAPVHRALTAFSRCRNMCEGMDGSRQRFFRSVMYNIGIWTISPPGTKICAHPCHGLAEGGDTGGEMSQKHAGSTIQIGGSERLNPGRGHADPICMRENPGWDLGESLALVGNHRCCVNGWIRYIADYQVGL